ncbi:MAG: NAD(P)-binding protein [Moorea sp. SIO2B7]|nr:NAD(P)-binding protein [Moorena sp. SIO2B7]
MSNSPRIGIIGAGIAGLTLGYQWQKQGFAVEIFDKGRAVGGRTSSRRTQWGYLDHGAQYLTVRNPQFQEFIKANLPPYLLVPWTTNFARLEEDKISLDELDALRYIPRQSMSNLCKYLAANLSVKTGTKIHKLKRDQHWILEDINGHDYGAFDLVVITAPPTQTVELLSQYSPIAQEIAQIEMWPCWTLMLISENQVSLPFGGIKCKHPVIGWIALNNSKPERGSLTSIIIQANWQWSEDNLAQKQEFVADFLRQAAEKILDVNFSPLKYESTHLWRYAAPKNPARQPYFLDQINHLAASGDWCVAGKIEGAFLSALSLAEAKLI